MKVEVDDGNEDLQTPSNQGDMQTIFDSNRDEPVVPNRKSQIGALDFCLNKRLVTYVKQDGVFTCELCNKTLDDISFLARHTDTHKAHKKVEIVGDIEDLQAPLNQVDAQINFDSKNEEPGEISGFNDDNFSSSTQSVNVCLDIQLATHSGHQKQHQFNCVTCNKSYSTKSILNAHMKKHDETLWFSCSTCTRSFTTKKGFERHVRTHTGERPYSCLICTKSFTRKDHLQCHIRTHTGEQPFSCSTCGKSFTKKQHLRSHMNIHDEKLRFSCTTCTKSFTTKQHLERHVRVHTGERPFSCSTCTKSFTTKQHLKRHVRTHTGEQPFSCSTCGKSFTTKQNLEHHVRTHTGE